MLSRIRGASGPRATSTASQAEGTAERRQAERFDTAVSARVVMGGREHAALIDNLSVTGMTLQFVSPPALFVGALLEVRPDSFAPISGTVRWVKDGRCGLSLSRVLADMIVEEAAAEFACRKTGALKGVSLGLPAAVRAPGLLRRVTIEDIKAAGMIFRIDQPLARGLGIMLDIDGLMPIGAHVRWNAGGRCGAMLTKLLPVRAAEEIARRCHVLPAWLQELRAAHAETD